MTSAETPGGCASADERSSSGLLVRLIFVISAFLAAWVSIPRLINEWQRNPSGDHVFIVLIVAFFLWWRGNRNDDVQAPLTSCFSGASDFSLLRATGKPDLWFALFLCGFSMVLLAADAMVEEEFLLALGLWAGVLGSLWLILSQLERKRLLFPFFLLLFCLPLPPYAAFNYLQFPLQKLCTIWTAGLLDLLGHEAGFSGTVIHIGKSSLRVVEECSGVKFLTALTFVALLAGYLRLRKHFWLRAVLFGSAVPLAVVTNILRLTIAGEILIYRGSEAALAFIHSHAVLAFYLLAIMLQLMLVRIFEGFALPIIATDGDDPVQQADSTVSVAESSVLPPFIGSARSNHGLIMATIWCLVVFAGSLLAVRLPPAHVIRPGLDRLELVPAGWSMVATNSLLLSTPFTPDLNSAKQHRSQVLQSPRGLRVTIEVAWWPGRRPRNRLIVFHQAIICPTGIYAAAIKGEQSFAGGAAAYSIIQGADGPKTIFYWLQSDGQISAQPFTHAVWQYVREFRGLSADGCFVLVAVHGSQESALSAEVSGLVGFLRAALQSWFHEVPLAESSASVSKQID